MAEPNASFDPPERADAEQSPAASDGPIDQGEIEALLSQASQKAEPAADSSGPVQPSQALQTTETSQSDSPLGQDDIDRLLGQAGAGPASDSAGTDTAASHEDAGQGEVNQDDVDCLLNQAEEALRSIDAEPEGLPGGAILFQFREFAGATPSSESATLDLLSDVELDLKIELGRTHMYLEDVLRLRRGSVVPLDKLAGDPVDIYVNGRLIARGEVLVLNDNFCVRVAELMAGAGLE